VQRLLRVLRPPTREKLKARIRELAQKIHRLDAIYDDDKDCDAPDPDDDPDYRKWHAEYESSIKRCAQLYGDRYDPYRYGLS
jgi:hypothetical protein